MGKIQNKYDVVLVLCPPWSVDYPPTGINYLKSYVVKKGFSVKFIDFNLHLYKKKRRLRKYWKLEFANYWTIKKKFEKLIRNFDKDIKDLIYFLNKNTSVVGFSAYQNNIKFIVEIAKRIKQKNPNIKTIVGGPSCLIERERKYFKNKYFDYIIIGEGEEPLVNILKSDDKNKNLPGVLIPGKENEFIHQDKFELKNMEWSKDLDFENYFAKDRISIFLSKGCIGKCSFCNDRNLMGKFRTRPPRDVIEEIRYYVSKGIRNFAFNDLLINGDIEVLEDFCDLIIQKNIDIDWIANAIPMENLTKKILTKLKKSGCNILMYGVETGSQEVLDDMGKYFKIKIAENVLENSKKIGIQNWVNFIVGYPTETEEDFQQTLDFVDRNRKNIDKIAVAHMCGVMYNSDLMKKRHKYNILLPEDDTHAEIMWKTKDNKNNFDIRKKRLARLLRKFKELDLDVQQTNIHNWDHI